MADDLSWDDDSFEPAAPTLPKPPAAKGPWDDEDAEEEETKESWEEEETKAKPSPTTTKPKKKAVVKKAAEEKDKPLDDPIAEKLRQQRLVEESDYQATKELFGGSTSKDGKSLEDFIPKSEAEFLEYADMVASKITPFEKSFHYMTLLKALARKATEQMKGDDTKAFASAITVIANEKLKAEKEAAAGRKKIGKKKQVLLVDKAEEDDYRNSKYDDPDDYDFM